MSGRSVAGWGQKSKDLVSKKPFGLVAKARLPKIRHKKLGGWLSRLKNLFVPPGPGKMIKEVQWLAARGEEGKPVLYQAKVCSHSIAELTKQGDGATPAPTEVAFEIVDAETKKVVAEAKGKIEKGFAKGEWTWEPEDDVPPETAKFFIKATIKAGEKEETAESRKLLFIGKGLFVTLRVHSDPEDPDDTDNSYRLVSTCGEYERVQLWGQGEPFENGVALTFTRLQPGLKYNLEVDPGGGRGKYFAVKNIEAGKDRVKKHMDECKQDKKGK